MEKSVRIGFREHGGQPLNTDSKADAGNIGAAEIPDEMVVTSAADDGILGAQKFGSHFEGGPGVVVEPPDHFCIQMKGEIEEAQRRLDLLEVVPASGAEKIGQKRGPRDDRGAGFHLAVENAERIGSDPSAAVAAELLFAAAQKREDRLAKGGPARGAAEGIDLQSQLPKPEFFQKVEQHQDQLRIGARVIRAEDLGVDLMELSVTPLLRPLAPEHGADGVELRDRFGGMEGVFQVGADDGRRRLRPERQGFFAAVEEGVHLFFNDIG